MLYNAGMIERHIHRACLRRSMDPAAGCSPGGENLEYWLSRPTEERLGAVEFLRRQYYGRSAARLRRVVSVADRP